MILPTYKSIEEKKEFYAKQRENGNKEFSYHQIDTIEDLKERLDELTRSEILVFRGVKESKYKLYTSAQREWITNEWSMQLGKSGFADFIDQILFHLKKNGLLAEYFESLDNPYDILKSKVKQLIEGLQEIGISKRLKACLKQKNTPKEAYSISIEILIDNIYDHFIINSKYSTMQDLRMLSFLQHYGAPTPLIDFTYEENAALLFAIDGISCHRHGGEDIDNYFSLYACQYNGITSIEDILNLFKNRKRESEKSSFMSRSLLEEWTLIFISNPCWLLMPASTVASWSNPNIIAQKGCFFLNPDGIEPLEAKREMRKMTCLDIHKSLAPYIREEYLKSKGITKESLFPDFNAIANDAYEAFKRNPTAKLFPTDLPASQS